MESVIHMAIPSNAMAVGPYPVGNVPKTLPALARGTMTLFEPSLMTVERLRSQRDSACYNQLYRCKSYEVPFLWVCQ